ncbi:MAG: hypothetical protein AAGA28_19285 [Pseudomonadota bacterium]
MTEQDHIFKWRRINARLTTSGQPDVDHLPDIRKPGVTDVINLGPGQGMERWKAKQTMLPHLA